jgi:hypothetical protein
MLLNEGRFAMSIPLARRLSRRSSKHVTGAGPATGPAHLYLTLAAEGADPAPDQRSLPRRMFILLAALLVLMLVPLSAAATANGADQAQAVLVKASDDDGEDDDDDDGDGGKGKADSTGDNDTGTGRETAAANTDQPGLETGASTRGETDQDKTGKTETGHTTGAETRAANTDRPGLKTGVSTRGETDPGDNTGKTERR